MGDSEIFFEHNNVKAILEKKKLKVTMQCADLKTWMRIRKEFNDLYRTENVTCNERRLTVIIQARTENEFTFVLFQLAMAKNILETTEPEKMKGV